MSLQDIWLSNLRRLVDELAPGPNKRPAYREIATRARLSEEYVYQLYTGKPKPGGSPRVVGIDAAQRIGKAFEDGRGPGWFNQAPMPASPSPLSRATAPPPPPYGFRDRHQVSDSDWQLLEDISMLPIDEQEQLRTELRARARRIQEIRERFLAELRAKGRA